MARYIIRKGRGGLYHPSLEMTNAIGAKVRSEWDPVVFAQLKDVGASMAEAAQTVRELWNKKPSQAALFNKLNKGIAQEGES